MDGQAAREARLGCGQGFGLIHMSVIIINPNSTEAMTETMLEAARLAEPSLSFEGWTSHDGPPAIQGPKDGEAASGPLIELVKQAEIQKASAVIIGCFDDTALADAAKEVSIPVIGIGQAAFHYCALRQMRFSVVTTLSVSIPVISDNIADYGLSSFVGRVRASEVPVLGLADAPEVAEAAVRAEAERAIAEDQIAAVVLGCAGMTDLKSQLDHDLSAEIVEPVESAARCAAWLTKS